MPFNLVVKSMPQKKKFKEKVIETLATTKYSNLETEELRDVDEEEDEDYQKHDQLLQKIGKLQAKADGKRKREMRTEASSLISENTLTPVTDDSDAFQLKLNELVKGIRDPSGSLRKQLKKVQRKKVLNLPIEKPLADKITRTTNYEDAKKELSKWEPIVEANRTAKHLEFPLKQDDLRLIGANEFVSRFTQKTDLEEEVHQLLEEASETSAVQIEEKHPENENLSLEEAQARHRELQRMRAIMSYRETKLKRQKRIKSKSYRKLLKKERLKKEMKAFDELKEKNPEEALEKLKELDKLRALERASLRHKNTGKWAKHKLLRAKNNKEARDALAQQVEISKKLLKKAVAPESESESEPSFDVNEKDSDSEEEPLPVIPLGYNPWINSTKKSAAAKENNKAQSVSIAVEKAGNVSETQNIRLDPKKFLSLESTKVKSAMPDLEDANSMTSDLKSNEEDEMDQRKLISEAFAEDDVVNNFAEEKDEVIEKEENKDISLYLPGWGEWAGAGIKPNRKKAKKLTKKAKKLERKDGKLPHVIISEKRNEAVSKYMVKDLPFPFKNVKEFEHSIRHPIGNTWNPEVSFRKLIEPKVTTKMGKIIEPMDSEDLAKYQSKEGAPEVALKDIISIS